MAPGTSRWQLHSSRSAASCSSLSNNTKDDSRMLSQADAGWPWACEFSSSFCNWCSQPSTSSSRRSAAPLRTWQGALRSRARPSGGRRHDRMASPGCATVIRLTPRSLGKACSVACVGNVQVVHVLHEIEGHGATPVATRASTASEQTAAPWSAPPTKDQDQAIGSAAHSRDLPGPPALSRHGGNRRRSPSAQDGRRGSRNLRCKVSAKASTANAGGDSSIGEAQGTHPAHAGAVPGRGSADS
mmetsp:Transcript_68873/g.211221  ORF Transcript_68873/g.211221 Transcript_68873/m.211221 type:complete len:243 (+) Transcript_68873:156-884(+)